MRAGVRGIGAALGIGAIVSALLLLMRPRQPAAAALLPVKLPRRSQKFPPLVERWRTAVEARANDVPVDAVLEWIRIESGGDMCAVGSPSEVGIFQLYFPGDAEYGATLEGLRALCLRSKRHNPADLSWLTAADLDMQVGAGIRKIQAARQVVRRVFSQNGIHWPENSFDFGSAVKQIHSTPAVISELIPKISRKSGPPLSWGDLRSKVLTYPPDQMGTGLRRLWGAPSKHGLRNRLEDTMRNAEFVGRAWAGTPRNSVAVYP